MGLLLIVLGLVIWLLLSPILGLILVVLGIVLLFIPGVPYGYSSYRGGGDHENISAPVFVAMMRDIAIIVAVIVY